MKSVIPFFKTFWLSLNPWRYDEVHERDHGQLFKYLLSCIFLAFFITTIALTPWVAGFVDDELSHFDEFTVDFQTKMNSPLQLPAHNPMITIDTRMSEGNLTQGKLLITNDFVYRKSFSGDIDSTAISEIEDVLENKGAIAFFIIMLFPALFCLLFILYAVKALIVILIAALLGWIISRILRFEVSFGAAFKCGLLAVTPMIIIDVLTKPFGFKIYGAQYVVFLIFFIVGLIKAGNTEETNPYQKRSSGKRRTNKNRYIELKVPRD